MKIIKKIYKNGNIHYGYYDDNKNFIFHNEDGPAIIGADESKVWFIHGEYHREDGPAVIDSDGSKRWYINGNLHREDGPAIIYADGIKEWWANNNHISEEVEKWLEERNIDPDNLSEEDKLALSFYLRSLFKVKNH